MPDQIEIRVGSGTRTIFFKGAVIAVLGFDGEKWQINVYPTQESILGMSAPTVETAIAQAVMAYCRENRSL